MEWLLPSPKDICTQLCRTRLYSICTTSSLNRRTLSTLSNHSPAPNIKVKRLWPVLKTGLPAHLIGGISETPVPRQTFGSSAPSLVKVERLWQVLKTFAQTTYSICTTSRLNRRNVKDSSTRSAHWVLSPIAN